MDLALRSIDIYAASYGVVVIFAIVLGVLAVLALVRRRGGTAPESDGLFHWAQAEMAQFAAELSPEPRESAALFGAELVFEARRMIAEVSDEQQAKVNVEEALAHGLGATASSGLRRRLSSHLERLDPTERRVERGSRFMHLRGILDADDAPAAHRKSDPQLGWDGARRTSLVVR